MARRGEFSTSVYLQVLERGVCEDCGMGKDEHDPFQVHHKIYLASEAAKQFPLELLKSIANAQVLHKGCHDHIHNLYDEPPQDVIDQVVNDYRVLQLQQHEWLMQFKEKQTRKKRIV